MNKFRVIEHADMDTVYVDWMITGGGWGGVVNYTLGTVIHAPDGEPMVKAASRVRLTSANARSLAAALVKWADQSESSVQEEAPPANTKLN